MTVFILLCLIFILSVYNISSFHTQWSKNSFQFGSRSLRMVGSKYNVREHRQQKKSKIKPPTVSTENAERDALVEKIKENIKPGSTIVIKFGGNALENEDLQNSFIDDIEYLVVKAAITPVIVHGAGAEIAKMLSDHKVEPTFLDGVRITDQATWNLTEIVLTKVNYQLARKLGDKPSVKGAVPITGLDNNMIQAIQPNVDLGFVGEPVSVDPTILRNLMAQELVPIIVSIGHNMNQIRRRKYDTVSLNLPTDKTAGAVAKALQADKLLLFTDYNGIENKNNQVLERISVAEVPGLTTDGIITGGMVPKVETAVAAVEGGVGEVTLLDGRQPYAVLRALAGESFGTVITR